MRKKRSPKKSSSYIFIAAIAAFSGILFGYDTGVISGAVLFIESEFNLSPQLNGVVVAAVLFGALLGSACSGQLTDRYGRRKLLIADSLIFILGSLVAAIAPTIPILILGRIVVGIAIGAASYIAPLYISEIAPVSKRGALVSFNQLAITIGILLSYVVDYFLAEGAHWRWMFAIGVIPAICLLIGMLYLPYSPRWLVSRGHHAKALDVLYRLRGDLTQAELELEDIKNSIQVEKGSWRELFFTRARLTLLIGAGLAVIQQVTGINTIIYYAPTIFKMAGFQSAASAILATGGVGIVFVLFTIIALPLIDKWGRKPLLYAGLVGMGLSLGFLSYAFQVQSEAALLKWLSLTSMLVYIACFAFSLGPIMWLMIAEIYPLRVRGLGSSIATCFNWGSNMLVALTFLSMIEAWGASTTFLIYMIISFLSICFIGFYVPETKNISLEQIEANLYAGKPARKLGR